MPSGCNVSACRRMTSCPRASHSRTDTGPRLGFGQVEHIDAELRAALGDRLGVSVTRIGYGGRQYAVRAAAGRLRPSRRRRYSPLLPVDHFHPRIGTVAVDLIVGSNGLWSVAFHILAQNLLNRASATSIRRISRSLERRKSLLQTTAPNSVRCRATRPGRSGGFNRRVTSSGTYVTRFSYPVSRGERTSWPTFLPFRYSSGAHSAQSDHRNGTGQRRQTRRAIPRRQSSVRRQASRPFGSPVRARQGDPCCVLPVPIVQKPNRPRAERTPR